MSHSTVLVQLWARVRQPQMACGRLDQSRGFAESSLAPLMQAGLPNGCGFERRIEGMRRIGSIAGVAMIKNLHLLSPIAPKGTADWPTRTSEAGSGFTATRIHQI